MCRGARLDHRTLPGLRADGDGAALLAASQITLAPGAQGATPPPGIITAGDGQGKAPAKQLTAALLQQRFWEREADEEVPA
jgi:hypothetical protein